jgi:folate-binding protein YgfZ
MPNEGDWQGEYCRACKDIAVFQLNGQGTIQVIGEDAGSFLHNLCTNDVKGLRPNFGREAFFTTGQARVLGLGCIFLVFETDGRHAFWVDLPSGLAPKILQHLDRHLISERVELRDCSNELTVLHCAGPRAADALEKLGSYSVSSLAPLQLRVSASREHIQQIRRFERVALPGFDIVCAKAAAPVIVGKLSDMGAKPADEAIFEILRVEAGMPLYGQDMDETNLPQEIGRTERAISFTKGCYIGQETIARIRTYGHVNRSLVGVRLVDMKPPLAGSKITIADKEIGLITSAVYSPRAECAIALAYVRRGYDVAGTRVEIWAAGDKLAAEVVSLPFVGGGANRP